MCATCGCDQEDKVTILMPGEEIKVDELNLTHAHTHSHDHNGHHHHHHHDHDHDHSHSHSHSIELELERDVLAKNNLLAERNRGFFEARNMLAINLVSSPGSGKTTILEKTIQSLKEEIPLYIVEGDQQTLNDAERIQNAGAPVVQVNTGKGCHLDSDMVNQAIKKLNPDVNSLFFIENVGNLVCPSLFDLGEQFRVVIMSTTEGEDKPIKYPNMFETSQLCLINKTDLLPYLNFDIEKAKEYALKVNPHLEILEVSATSGEGMDKWLEWLKEKVK